MWVILLATENITTGRLPLFYERDEAFVAYIKELYEQKQDSRDEFVKELDEVWYMFSHIILSNNNLESEYAGLRDIECQNGFKLVVKKPTDGLVLLAGVSADVGEFDSVSTVG